MMFAAVSTSSATTRNGMRSCSYLADEGSRHGVAGPPGVSVPRRCPQRVPQSTWTNPIVLMRSLLAIHPCARRRWRPAAGHDRANHPRMDRAVIVDAIVGKLPRGGGGAWCDVTCVEGPVIQHNPMRHVVAVAPHDHLILACRRWVGRKRLRAPIPDDSDSGRPTSRRRRCRRRIGASAGPAAAAARTGEDEGHGTESCDVELHGASFERVNPVEGHDSYQSRIATESTSPRISITADVKRLSAIVPASDDYRSGAP
jgi:hypothetical protein